MRTDDPLHPDSASAAFKRAVRRSGLPYLSLHGLRHVHASLGLGAGQSLKLMSERLGHSSVSVTGDIYSHVTPQIHSDAAEEMASLVDAVVPTDVPTNSATRAATRRHEKGS